MLPPVKTMPGQAIDGVTLKLTRPATVRGKVVDAKGRPVADREVYARPADGLENRYYDPTATTAADGTFELKFLRPGEQLLRAYGNTPAVAPVQVTLTEGQAAEGVTLVAAEEPPK